ncbi:MAG TPA: O-antigen ligase family protein [Phycisphaerae bacterium]|nr:O-antigen ligase family protein [Phycisphaerae bacterium]
MPYENSSESLTADTPRARLTSRLLMGVAGLALILNCLLTSPARFSEAHHADTSFFKRVVAGLALVGSSADAGAFPTARLVDIRSLIFGLGAALLSLIGAARLLTARARPRLSSEDMWDIRERAKSPLFWLGVLLAVSVVTSYFSHAPAVSMGQVAIRFMHAAWWWPLAVLLLDRNAQRLSTMVVLAVTLSCVVGIWYLSARGSSGWWRDLAAMRLPAARLEYPIGNSLWFGACILPAIFVALGVAMDTFGPQGKRHAQKSAMDETPLSRAARVGKCRRSGTLCVVALPILLIALLLTQARSSAWVGFAAGVFGIAFLAARRGARPYILLGAVLLALYGAWQVQRLRVHGVMGERAHSIRSRLNHEWPYAIALFTQKPVGGHGEGCYTMLAPQFARIDQLQEPSVMAFDEQLWYAHAHNEFLELLADLGIVGLTAFILALAATMAWAVRYCDRARENPETRPYRWLVIGLGAALVGMTLEEGSSVALRHPGFPPIFLTVWAGLWAVVRSERAASMKTLDAAGSNRVGVGWYRSAGVVSVFGALALGYLAVEDWRGIRAYQKSLQAAEDGSFTAAMASADFAGERILDPFFKLSSWVKSVDARVVLFGQSVASDARASDADIELARSALMRLNRLSRAAPRFLQVSRLAMLLNFTMARAASARGESKATEDYLNAYRAWLQQSAADDPFDSGLVQQMWVDIPDAAPIERLGWLKRLMRRGEMDDAAREMAEDLFRRIPGSVATLHELLVVADADANRPASSWQDALSPESQRLGALLADWTGQAAEAERLAQQAAAMYASAGEGLFAARAAAMRESVLYGLHVDPVGRTDDLLTRLVRAREVFEGPVVGTPEDVLAMPLPREFGLARGLVLAAAGRDDAVRKQLDYLKGPTQWGEAAPSEASIYASLADQFQPKAQFADLAMKWAQRAKELDDALPEAHFTLLALYLSRGQDAEAEQAARRFIELIPDRDRAYMLLQNRERRWPESSIWQRLRRDFADYPELPIESPTGSSSTQPTSAPVEATQPSTAPVGD